MATALADNQGQRGWLGQGKSPHAHARELFEQPYVQPELGATPQIAGMFSFLIVTQRLAEIWKIARGHGSAG